MAGEIEARIVSVYHVVLFGLTLTVLALGWGLVHTTPPLLSRILPPKLTFIAGAFLFGVAAFGACFEAQASRSGEGLVGMFVTMMIGVWFMLAPSSGLRGTFRDGELIRRVFIMMSVLFTILIAALYLPAQQAIAVLNLMLVISGFWLTTNFLRQIDGRR